MSDSQKFATRYAAILGGCFVGGVLLASGIALGNRLTGWPLITSSVHQVSTNQVNLFTADGVARLTVVPDQAEVTAGVSITAPAVKTAQDQANAITNQLRAQLVNLGVEPGQIKTQNYSVYPEYDWSGSTRRVTGYTVDSSLRVTVTDFALLNNIIDTATAAGANEIGNIRFTLSDEQQEQLRRQARQEAIQQARENAQELAALTGLRLGNIVNVSESTEDTAGRLYTTNMKMAVTEDALDYGTNIEAGETTYTYFVTLSYQTL